MKKSLIVASFILGVAAVAYAGDNPAGTVVGSAHDLSTPGSAGGQICVFCHTPHNANSDTKLPLWSHAVTQQTFTPYNNADFSTVVAGQPGSVSKACLGCHDGSIGLGYVANGAFKTDGTAANDLAVTAKGSADSFAGTVGGASIAIGDDTNIGGNADLSTTHPVGITYPTSQIGTNFNDVASNTNVKLFKEGNATATQIECASCHEPHNQGAKEAHYFLRSTNDGSALCLTCHIK